MNSLQWFYVARLNSIQEDLYDNVGGISTMKLKCSWTLISETFVAKQGDLFVTELSMGRLAYGGTLCRNVADFFICNVAELSTLVM